MTLTEAAHEAPGTTQQPPADDTSPAATPAANQHGVPLSALPTPTIADPAIPDVHKTGVAFLVTEREPQPDLSVSFLLPGDKFKIDNSPCESPVFTVVKAQPLPELLGWFGVTVAELRYGLTLSAYTRLIPVYIPRTLPLRCGTCQAVVPTQLNLAVVGQPKTYDCGNH
ncbi:hypothetical protein ACQEVF_57595 [Nonomuraea polychroma]|uniref:hypothetical protein n=1 Tax=Nonomuraea polychroma TaxID=46176 RepID=UPI003D91C462